MNNPPTTPAAPKKRVYMAILAMGFSGLVAEILLLRELLIVFSGNEFSIGIILANWLILEAFGSFYFGRKFEKSRHGLEIFVVMTILFFLSLPAAAFLARNLKNIIGVSVGESITLWPMFYSSFLILLPVSMLHGALFTSSCRIDATCSGQDPTSVGKVYVYETVGTVIGAIVCTYLLIPYLHTFQTFSWLALFNFIVCLALLVPYPCRKAGLFRKTLLIVLSAVILCSGYWILTGQADNLHRYAIRSQWSNHTVAHYQNSPYGNICVIENEGQYIFFQDGIPTVMTPVPDIPFVEEIVHFPALAHPKPEKLLILGGGAGGIINEALKHPSIEKIDYTELDPLLIRLFRKFPTDLTESELNDERVRIKHVDGRLFLRSTHDRYDLILTGIAGPSNLQANRFFTQEFFALARERLNAEGILVFGLPGSLTYMNREMKNLNSSIYRTLNGVFSYIRVIPGDGANLFLASDSRGILEMGETRMIERLRQRNIQADVVVPWYIERKLHPGWQEAWLSDLIEGSSRKINSDFTPRGVFYSISHWNTLFAPYLRLPFSKIEKLDAGTLYPLFVLPLLLYLLFRSGGIRKDRAGIPFAIVTTGFAGMIFNLMLIFAFQSIYGYVFSWIGLLMASFMAGAACGAMWITRNLVRKKSGFEFFAKIEMALVCFSILCPLTILGAYSYLGDPDQFFLSKAFFAILSFVGGTLIGSQFPLANQLYLREGENVSKTAGLLFASDLLGGWFGGMMGAVVLLPVLGLWGAGLVVALLKLTSFVVVTTQPKAANIKRSENEKASI